MSNYLKLKFLDSADETFKQVDHYHYRNKPFSNSDVFCATIVSFKLLTRGDNVKRVYNLKLCSKAITHNFLPGDTIGVLPCNDHKEVQEILTRLKIEDYLEKFYQIGISEKTTKKNAVIPKHIPKQGRVKDIFTYYVDIRKPPKKMFLKALIPFTNNSEEIKLLERMCSPSGSKEYTDLISKKAQTLLRLLNTFPSCNPPVELILEHSLPLQPRYYSISSSPLQEDSLNITFFIVENEDGTKGVCTGWLENIIKKIDIEPNTIPFYFRTPNNFRIPNDLSTHLILISAGTGIAPFVGFLNHRSLIKNNADCAIGKTLLFYGCRYPDRDYLHQDELREYLQKKVLTKLYTAFSRLIEKKRYVQDEILENGEEFIDVLNSGAIVYVCGDTKTMVKGVKEALITNFVKYGHLEESTAKEYLNVLVKDNRFITDCWT